MPDADPELMTIFAEALERTDPADAGRLPGRRLWGRRRPPPAGRGAARRPRRGRPVPGTRLHRHVRTRAPGTEEAIRDVRTGNAPPPELATGEHRPDGTITTVPDARRPPAPTGSSPGQVIAGRYTLLEVLGEGGMGTVYRAEQTEPVKRQVALKLIKIGMDSRAVLARFDAERQALALMDHPNIARVYDGGTTAAGQPFFVMELVERRADHRVLRPATGSRSGPGWSCSSPSARRCSTPTRRGSSTAT